MSRTLKLIAATLDSKDVLVWPKSEFLDWRTWLHIPSNAVPGRARELLWVAQCNGGETELDKQGRMLLPKAIRDALDLKDKPVDFRIVNEGLIRLTRPESLNAKRDFSATSTDHDLDAYAVEQYGRFLGVGAKSKGGEDE